MAWRSLRRFIVGGFIIRRFIIGIVRRFLLLAPPEIEALLLCRAQGVVPPLHIFRRAGGCLTYFRFLVLLLCFAVFPGSVQAVFAPLTERGGRIGRPVYTGL
jgi:hypothetical protein